MFMKCHKRFKDGKEHRYWSIAEKRRCADGRAVDRHVLYLGEINDTQKASWTRCIEVFDEQEQEQKIMALFADEGSVPDHALDFGVQVRLRQFSLHRPRQWGACWVFLKLWEQLKLEEFWSRRLPSSREGTSWYRVFMVLCAYRLIDPGSEWRLHRQWFQSTAMGDLLGEEFSLVAKDNLYRCLDRLLEHKEDLFVFLKERWKDLFGAKFDVLLYDLTSTYFESDPPFEPGDKRRFGYSRDRRSDCVQVVIALVVTPEGFPLAYEVLPGNTSDKTTLEDFLKKVEQLHGKARRIWVMDRGIPTEKALEKMRKRKRYPIQYIVGTPKGKLNALEKRLLNIQWQQARPAVRVKLLGEGREMFVFVDSQARVDKERAMRRRKLKRLWNRLKELARQRPGYESLMLKLGAAKKEAGRAWSLVKVKLPDPPPKSQRKRRVSFSFELDRKKLRMVRRREGRYLLRTNMVESDPAKLWAFYLQLTEVEEAFKNLKGDLEVRPIFHQLEHRIEAHIFVAFMAYCLHVTLKTRARAAAPGLTPRQVLEKFGQIQMVDAHFPTTDNRTLVLRRYTQPEPDHRLLLDQLKWQLPDQPPPRITAKRDLEIWNRPSPCLA